MEEVKKNTHYIDEHVARLVALIVVVLTLTAISAHLWYILLFLALDFALRGFTTIRAPLAYLGTKIVKVIGLKPKPVFAPPKRFAAQLGFVLSIVLLAFTLQNVQIGLYIIAAILIICALLESAFGVCLGCIVYNNLIVPLKRRFKTS